MLGGIGSYQQSESASYNQKIAEQNADIERKKAAESLRQGREDVFKHGQQVNQLLGQQKAAYGASGAVLEEGSPLNVVVDTSKWGAYDSQTIKYNSKKEAWAHEVNATNFDNQASLYKSQSSQANAAMWMGFGQAGLAAGGLGAGVVAGAYGSGPFSSWFSGMGSSTSSSVASGAYKSQFPGLSGFSDNLGYSMRSSAGGGSMIL